MRAPQFARRPGGDRVSRLDGSPAMGNACCASPQDGDGGGLSRTRTPAAPPSSLDVVASGSPSWSLAAELPQSAAACRRLQQLWISDLHRAGAHAPSRLGQWEALAKVMPQCTQLRQLVITDCGISGEEMGLIASALSSCNTLESLDLSRNDLNDYSIETLAHALPGCVELQSLGLRENPFGARGIDALAAKLPTLRSLTLLTVHGVAASCAPLEGARGPRLQISYTNQQTVSLTLRLTVISF